MSSNEIQYWGGHTSHTGQIFFNDTYTTSVQDHPSYNQNQAEGTFNTDDRVYQRRDDVDSIITLAFVDKAKGVSAGSMVLKGDSTVG